MLPLHVLSAGSALHGLRACADSAAQAVGRALDITTSHGHLIHDAVRSGAARPDLVLLPTDMLDALGTRVGERLPLGTVAIAGTVRAGAARPAIGTMAELRAAFVAAPAVLLTSAPTGDRLMEVIARLGLTDLVTAKLLRFDTSSKLLAHLAARGDDAIGFSPESEIRGAPGVACIGLVPDEIQVVVPYAAAVLTSCAQPEAARALLAFLATPIAREAFARSGVRLG